MTSRDSSTSLRGSAKSHGLSSLRRRSPLAATMLGGALLLAAACSSDEKSSEPDYISELSHFESELSDRMLSSLSDEEIVAACEDLQSATSAADAMIACQVVAAAETSSAGDCKSERSDCIASPADALDQSTVSATPAPIDCSLFSADLTDGCDFPVSKLEECANAMIDSVISSAEAVKCSSASEFDTVADADAAAKLAQSADFVAICAPLLECEALVSVLLTGELPGGNSGAGGAGGAAN